MMGRQAYNFLDQGVSASNFQPQSGMAVGLANDPGPRESHFSCILRIPVLNGKTIVTIQVQNLSIYRTSLDFLSIS